MRRTFQYAHHRRPRAIIIENVSTWHDGAHTTALAGLELMLASLNTRAVVEYRWFCAARVSPHTHAGIPAERERTFWIGIAQYAPTHDTIIRGNSPAVTAH